MNTNTKNTVSAVEQFGRRAEMEIDLLELGQFLLTKLHWIILAFILGALMAGSATHFLIAPTYTATARMYMVSSSSDSVINLSDLYMGTNLSEDYAEIIKTRPIIEGVADELGLDYSYGQMMGMISLSVVQDTRILKIQVTSTDREEARNIANGIADAAKTELPKIMETPAPHIAERAITPEGRSGPSLTKNTMMGAMVLALLVIGLFTIQFLSDDTIKSAEDMEREFGVMPLTIIPEGKIEVLKKKEDNFKKLKKHRKKKKGA